MQYDDLIVLIPSHSLEDFPSELPEEEAAGLLNAFSVLWHPVLLSQAEALPTWHRADEPPEELTNRLVIVPTACDDWIPGGWVEHARLQGAVVVSGVADREEMLRAALAPLAEQQSRVDLSPRGNGGPKPALRKGTETRDSIQETAGGTTAEETVEQPAGSDDPERELPGSHPPAEAGGSPGVAEVDPDLAADFLALGTCHLQVELMTRRMHYFSNLDEVHLQRAALSAAEAALADDAEACRKHLQACFEALLEARERFYPVDCFLIDLCLLIPQQAGEHLDRALASGQPLNVVATAEDLAKIAAEKPALADTLKSSWDAGTLDFAGGELRDAPTPLLLLESVLWEFRQGHRLFRQHLGRLPTTWGRRRYGFSTLIPQIVSRLGYQGALHVALDDGVYPDAEHSKIRWEGCDGTTIDAVSRIPLAADSAVSYLRFPERMAESMEQDQVAAVILARWPEVKAPWFEDFRRIHSYAACLGRFVTFEHFFEQTDNPGRLSSYQAGEYFSPFLIQAVAREQANPIGRYTDYYHRRHRFDAALWYRAAARVLAGESLPPDGDEQDERTVEMGGPEGTDEEVERAERLISTGETESARRLAKVVGGGEREPGLMVFNSLSFPRRVAVELPDSAEPPALSETVKGVQFGRQRRLAVVNVPACGFSWIPTGGGGTAGSQAARREPPPTAEENVLRNELFEVYINEATGGIGTIKGYGRSPNRLSQQLAYRFPRERVIRSEEDDFSEKTYYSEMRCRSSEVTCSGPTLGEIVTSGDIVDQQNDSRLAGFRQTVRLWRGRPVVEVDLELEIDRMPDGNPWTNYYAARFAWNDSTAALTRSVQQGAQPFEGERFESPHYLEIADEQQRTTILFCGLPFHRKTGMRMVDTLLVTAGETRRRFRFVIAVDAAYPMQAALDAMTPPAVVPVQNRPRGGTSGWFFHLDVKNVQLTRLLPLAEHAGPSENTWEQHDRPGPADAPGYDHNGNTTREQAPASGSWGFAVRLVETEGRARRVKLRCFKTPASARQCDFRGRPMGELAIQDDRVLIDMNAYEIADVELRFEV